ncbi:MAG: hypothetical protein E7602_00500 [Ruminococcaceae bacterium]|nr:hypothetical protein [Oscillospiraceae bacterium]
MEQETNELTKKDLYKIAIIISAVVIVTLTFFYFLLLSKIDKISNPIKEDDTPVFEETTEIRYILKDYNGKIGVFENNSLIYTLDTYIFTLPEKDKKLLSEGICVSSKEELYQILEEYY